MARIDEFLLQILEKKGSDLHFLAGDPPRIRQFGELRPLRTEALERSLVEEALFEIMPKAASKRFEEHDGADFAYTMGEYGRFRVNVMRHLNGMGGVVSRDSIQSIVARSTQYAASRTADVSHDQRFDSGDGQDWVRQVYDARGHDRRHQYPGQRPHTNH